LPVERDARVGDRHVDAQRAVSKVVSGRACAAPTAISATGTTQVGEQHELSLSGGPGVRIVATAIGHSGEPDP
jgi:hypothetical protein